MFNTEGDVSAPAPPPRGDGHHAAGIEFSIIIPSHGNVANENGSVSVAPTPGRDVSAKANNAHNAKRRELDDAIRSMELWATANDNESQLLRETIELAKGLFLSTIVDQYDDTKTALPEDAEVLRVMAEDAEANAERSHLTPRSAAIAELMGSGSKFLADSASYQETRNGVMRAAVSCMLLERMCAIFARYHSVLGSINEMIFRSVFVPDTEEMRALLGGTVQFPLTTNVPPKYRSLLAPYARKTYFVAHDEVAAQVLALAKSNRSIEMRLSRQGKIFEVTVKHWVASIVRNLFVSWRCFTRKRKTLRQKFHAKFARLRVEEIKVHAIQNWRGRAAAVRRAAALDAGANELAQLTLSTEQLHESIVSLTDLNQNLGQRIMVLEKERLEMQAAIAQKEKLFVELQTRTVEMDRVGTELLDSMLLAEAPPRGTSAIEVLVAWGNRMIDDAGGAIDEGSGAEPLQQLLSEDFVVQMPLSSLAAVMVRFNSTAAPTREEVSMLHNSAQRAPQMLVDMYERLTEGPCLVNVDQVSSMQRGVLLLFLAGLMRHMSNWVINKPPPLPPHRKEPTASEASLKRQPSGLLRPPSMHNPPGSAVAEEPVYALPNDLAPHHNTWLDRVRTQQQWIATSMASLLLALEASTQRPPALTSEEQEDMVSFLDLTVASLFDILPHDGQSRPDFVFVQLIKSLQQLFPELRKVYLTYAVPAMQFMDFTRLAKDCRILGPNKITKKELEGMCREVYIKHNAGGATEGGREARGDEEEEHVASRSISPAAAAPHATISPSNAARLAKEKPQTVVDLSIRIVEPKVFVECIVRLAVLHHRRLCRDQLLPLSVGMVSTFILETVVPHALRLDVDRFRQTARHPLVRQVLSKHKVALRKAFRKYATVNDGDAMPKLQFQAMAKDCRWHLSKMITSDVLHEVFRRCCSGPDGDSTSVEGLDLSDWQEAICALAVYADPNPLVPLSVKLPVFIEEKVLSVLQV